MIRLESNAFTSARQENLMRGFVAIPILAIISLALFGTTPARAFGERHPFCLTGDEWPGLSNCRFDTYAQCQASASGRLLTCIANPYFAGQADDPYAYQNRYRREPPSYYWPR
jgi:uncharacterized protein DUF3551